MLLLIAYTVIPQEFHKNPRKLGVFDVSFATGWDEPLFWAMQFKTANKINGLKPVSYGMAVNCLYLRSLIIPHKHAVAGKSKCR